MLSNPSRRRQSENAKLFTNLIALRLALSSEVLRPLLHQKLRDEELAREPPDAVSKLPHQRQVQRLVLLADLLDEFEERLVNVADRGVIHAPHVDHGSLRGSP